ncbi:MAG: peptidylprolyl isomerase [Flavobacteriales bacterium]
MFGQVVEGMDVVDKIKVVQTSNAGGNQNVPSTPIVINSAVLLK